MALLVMFKKRLFSKEYTLVLGFYFWGLQSQLVRTYHCIALAVEAQGLQWMSLCRQVKTFPKTISKHCVGVALLQSMLAASSTKPSVSVSIARLTQGHTSQRPSTYSTLKPYCRPQASLPTADLQESMETHIQDMISSVPASGCHQYQTRARIFRDNKTSCRIS